MADVETNQIASIVGAGGNGAKQPIYAAHHPGLVLDKLRRERDMKRRMTAIVDQIAALIDPPVASRQLAFSGHVALRFDCEYAGDIDPTEYCRIDDLSCLSTSKPHAK